MIYYGYGIKQRTVPEDSKPFTPAKRACKNTGLDLTERSGLPW
jgi:hypothetical protein